MRRDHPADARVRRQRAPDARRGMEVDAPSGRGLGAAEMHHQHVHVPHELDEGGIRTVLVAAEPHADVSHVHPVPHGRHVGVRHPDAAHPDVAVAPDLGGLAGRDVHGDRIEVEPAAEHPEDPTRSEQPVQPVVQRRERRAPGWAGDPQPAPAGPQQRRHLGGMVGMEVTERKQPHVAEIGAGRMEALLDASAGVDEDAADAVDPDEIAGRGPSGGRARSPRAQDLEMHAGLSAGGCRRLDSQEKTEGRDDHRAEHACHHRRPPKNLLRNRMRLTLAVGHPYATVSSTSRWAGSSPSRPRQLAMMSSNRAAGMGRPGTTSRMRRASSSKSQMNSRPVACRV